MADASALPFIGPHLIGTHNKVFGIFSPTNWNHGYGHSIRSLRISFNTAMEAGSNADQWHRGRPAEAQTSDFLKLLATVMVYHCGDARFRGV